MIAKLVYKLASFWLSDESLLSILVRRGYTRMEITNNDGTPAYSIKPATRKRGGDAIQ